MASSAYNYSVRQGLNNKGIDNSRIGFSNGYVTVDGKNFQRADKNYNGSAFTNQQNFNNAWNSFSQPAARTTQSTPAAARVTTASPTPGSVGVRSALTSAGYKPSSIGYSNGAVTVNNQPFTVPSQNINGTSYTSPNQFSTALNRQRVGDLTTQVVNNTKLPENPYNNQVNDTISYLMNFAKNQQQVDPYSTPQYAAYQAQSARRANDGIRAAQEALGSAGFGRSTALGERAQGVQNQETEYLETQVIPQIIAAEQARQQQQYANISALLNPLMSQQQYADQRAQQELSNTYNALNYLTSEQQRGVENARADAALTGNYLTEDARNAINTLLGLKQQAETKGITASQRAALSGQADTIRAQLNQMGIDPALYGSNVSYNNARSVNPGRTIQGQQLDLQRQQQQFNNQFNLEQFAYQKARDAITDSQWRLKFDQDVQQFGMNYALNRLQEQNNQAYRQASLALDRDRLSWDQDKSIVDAEAKRAQEAAQNMTPQAFAKSYINPLVKRDDEGVVLNKNDVIAAAVASGYNESQIDGILAQYGVTSEDVKTFQKSISGKSISGN